MTRVLIIWCLWFGWCEVPPEPPPPPVAVVQAAPKAVAPSYESGNVEQWRGLVAAHFPAGEVDTALCIMWFESQGNPNAYNPSSATGLMQVKSSLWGTFGDLFDPTINMTAAAYVHSVYGWSAWSPWKRGECQ